MSGDDYPWGDTSPDDEVLGVRRIERELIALEDRELALRVTEGCDEYTREIAALILADRSRDAR